MPEGNINFPATGPISRTRPQIEAFPAIKTTKYVQILPILIKINKTPFYRFWQVLSDPICLFAGLGPFLFTGGLQRPFRDVIGTL